MKRLLLIVGLALAFAWHAKAQTCTGQSATNASISSIACSSAISVPASSAIVLVFYGNGWTGTPVPSGCGSNYDYPVTVLYGGVQGGVWVLPTSTSSVGSCTPTVTFSSSTNVNVLIAAWVISTATWEVEYPPWIANSQGSSYTLPSFRTVGPNDTAFAISFGNGSAASPLSASSPWSSAGALDNASQQLHIHAWQQTGLSPGVVGSSTFGNSSGNSQAVAYLILRNSAPTFGRGQPKNCSTGTGTVTAPYPCTFNHPWLTGDMVLGAIFYSPTAVAPALALDSPDPNVACTLGPGQTNNTTTSVLFACLYNGTPPGTPVTLRIDEAGAGVNTIAADLYMWETVGGVQYLSGSTSNQLQHTAGIMNPQQSGSANPVQTGTYYVVGLGPLDAGAASCSNNTQTYTLSSPYAALYTPMCTANILFMYDGVVTVSSPGQSVSSTVGTSNNMPNSLQTFLFGSTPYQAPTTLQTSQQYSNSATNISTLKEPTTSGTVVFCADTKTSVAWTIVSTPSLTPVIDVGGGSAEYVTGHFSGVAAGSFVVTISNSGGAGIFATSSKFKFLGATDVTADSGVVTGNSAPLTGNLTLTPTHTNEFGVACPYAISTSAGSNTYFTGISSTTQQPQGLGFSDNVSNSMYVFNASTIQAYGGVGTTDSGQSTFTALNIVLFPGTVSPTNTPPPSENFITKNDLKHWEGEFVR